MTVTYPLTLPTTIGIKSDSFHIMRNQEADYSNNGILTLTVKQGDKWAGTVEFRAAGAEEVADLLGFFDALYGQQGTFTMQHPNYAAMRGTASGQTGAIKGASQTGTVIAMDGFTAGSTFKRGDLIQIGATGAGCRLKRVVEDATVDGTGNVTLTVHPPVYKAHADNAPVYTTNCKGYFRLASTDVVPDVDHNKVHRISVAVEEVLP